MPKDRKVKVTHGSEQIDFSIPEDWFHKDDISETHIEKGKFATQLNERVTEVTRGMFKPDDLIKDPAFVKRVAEEKKDDVLKVLNISPSRTDVDVAKIVTETTEKIRREELTPLQKQMEASVGEIGQLRLRALDAEVAEACLIHGVVPDMADLVKLWVKEQTGWHGERKDWFVKKSGAENEFEISTDPKSKHPYAGVSELIGKTKQKGEKKSWFLAGTQPGPGYTGGGGSGAVTLEEFQKKSPAERTQFYRDNPDQYSQFMNQIRESGEDKLFNKAAPVVTAK